MPKNIFSTLLDLVSGRSNGNKWDSPNDLVLSFIHDYYLWNNGAYKRSRVEREEKNEAVKLSRALYQENIISKYCPKGFIGKLISYGSESNHAPDREVIVSESLRGKHAVIMTKHTNITGFVADYEYRLFKKRGSWFLGAVDYVDADGKYSGL